MPRPGESPQSSELFRDWSTPPVGPWDLFFPTDPTVALTGMVDPQRLNEAAATFPGGAVALVFALFWAPVGPGIPAGVLLARQVGLNPALVFGLYTLSDLLGACVCHPLYRLLRRYGGRVPLLRRIGAGAMRVALFGTRPPRAEDIRQGARGTWPVLFRIGVVGFGADLYTAGMLVAGLPVPRLAGWGAALIGDLIWFAILLATSIAAAQVTDRTWVQLVIMVVVMFVVPKVARLLVPALREPPGAPREDTVQPSVPTPGEPALAVVPVDEPPTERLRPSGRRRGRGRR